MASPGRKEILWHDYKPMEKNGKCLQVKMYSRNMTIYYRYLFSYALALPSSQIRSSALSTDFEDGKHYKYEDNNIHPPMQQQTACIPTPLPIIHFLYYKSLFAVRHLQLPRITDISCITISRISDISTDKHLSYNKPVNLQNSQQEEKPHILQLSWSKHLHLLSFWCHRTACKQDPQQ